MDWLPRGLLPALALALASSGALAAAEGTVILHTADGTAFPLRDWSLSYEYLAWQEGTPRFRVAPSRKETQALLVGKKAYPLDGQTLELSFTAVQREREREGVVERVTVQIANGLALVAKDGRRETPKLEPPRRELLLPDADKHTMLEVRSLELMGETLTGTRREFCLASFTPLVECPSEPQRQVVKVEFP